MAVNNIRADDLRELLRRRPEEVEIIDVRGKEEFAMAASSGAEVKNLRFGIFECFKDGGGEFIEGGVFRKPRSPGSGRRE